MLKEYGARWGVLVGVWLLFTTSAIAEEMPTSGIVYNTKETNSLVYFCEKNRGNTLDCDFTQTRVRKKAKAEDLKTRLDQARKGFPTSKELAIMHLTNLSP